MCSQSAHHQSNPLNSRYTTTVLDSPAPVLGSKKQMQFDKDQLNQLYRYALSLEHKPDLAYDLLQGALEKFLRAPATQVDHPLAYIKRIMRNLAIDQLRQTKNSAAIDLMQSEQIDVISIQPSALEGQCIFEEELEVLLEQLSPQERELLYLWAIEGYTIDEISQWQEVPRGTLLSRIHRLRTRLKADNPQLAASLRGGVH